MEASENDMSAVMRHDYESLFPHKSTFTNLTTNMAASLPRIGAEFEHPSTASKSIPDFTDDLYSQSIQCKNESSLLRSVFHSYYRNLDTSSRADLAMMENDVTPLHIVDDPWDESERRKMARSRLKDYSNVKTPDHEMPALRKGGSIAIGNQAFKVDDVVGRGGFAKVYLITGQDQQCHAVKVECPPNEWEAIISEVAKERLQSSHHPLLDRVFVDLQVAFIFNDASWIVTQYMPHGTLLDFVNNSKASKKSPLQYFELVLQIVAALDALHSIDIIHGDVKPDNFLVCSEYRALTLLSAVPQLKLIDFGCAIDMREYPPNTAFIKPCTTSAFVCTQMKLNQPWNYHTDYYGLAGTIFLLLTNSYMKIVQDQDDKWRPSTRLPRWTGPLWNEIFSILLNFSNPSDEFQVTYQFSPLPNIMERLKSEIASNLNG